MDFQKTDISFLRTRAALKWGRWGEDVISLSVADIDYPPPREVREGVQRWLFEDRSPYGHYQGDVELREALAQKLFEKNKLQVAPDDLVVIPGTMFAIFLVCYLFLDRGDEALISPAPVYGPFWKNVEASRAIARGHDLDMDQGFRFRADVLPELVNSRTRLVMVCNPHNPTGRVLSREELEAIARVAEEKDLLIFSDELYEDMVFEGEHISIASLGQEIFHRTITVYGFSKAFGIPGYRVAYMVVPGRLRNKVVEATKRIIVHTDTLAQAAAMGAMAAASLWLPAFMSHLKEMRDRVIDRLSRIPGVRCHRPQATPFVFADMRSFGLPSEEMGKLLLERAKVVLHPGRQFGPSGEGFMRLNFATSWEILSEALGRMEVVLCDLWNERDNWRRGEGT